MTCIKRRGVQKKQKLKSWNENQGFLLTMIIRILPKSNFAEYSHTRNWEELGLI